MTATTTTSAKGASYYYYGEVYNYCVLVLPPQYTRLQTTPEHATWTIAVRLRKPFEIGTAVSYLHDALAGRPSCGRMGHETPTRTSRTKTLSKVVPNHRQVDGERNFSDGHRRPGDDGQTAILPRGLDGAGIQGTLTEGLRMVRR